MIEYEIEGIPRPQGSKRHVGRGIMVENSKHIAGWRSFAKLKAVEAMRGFKLVEKPDAILVTAIFYFDRPQKHFLKSGLRDNAPLYHTGTPDTDKLLRALFDSMTSVVFHDDSQVSAVVASKLYGSRAMTRVKIERVR